MSGHPHTFPLFVFSLWGRNILPPACCLAPASMGTFDPVSPVLQDQPPPLLPILLIFQPLSAQQSLDHPPNHVPIILKASLKHILNFETFESREKKNGEGKEVHTSSTVSRPGTHGHEMLKHIPAFPHRFMHLFRLEIPSYPVLYSIVL